jgi:hypothetical protein
MRTDPDSMVCRCRYMPRSSNRLLRRNAAAGLLLAAVVCLAQHGQEGQPASKPAQTADAQATPNAAAQPAVDAAKLPVEQKTALAENERKKQITNDSSQLLTMALALKAEVDKTSKDTLSLNVIRKADEIEKLAHTVKEKIKQSPGPG